MRMASRGPSSSSTTRTRGSVMPGLPWVLASLMRSRQGQDEADLAFLSAQRQGSAVGFDDLLTHSRPHVEQLVRRDCEGAEKVLALERRELRRSAGERQAHPARIVRRHLEMDGHAPLALDAVCEEPNDIADRLGQLLAIGLDEEAA